MSNNNVLIEKKKALLAYKEKILEEIKAYERNIEDLKANHKNNSYFEDVDSSDSEDDFPHAIDTGPTIPQLKLQQAMLKTCLQATQELTSLTVLQSEVNVLVEDPKLEGEKPVTEPGTWTEVTAECRIDLVPFTLTFFMHKPDRKFAPPSYRGLRVVPVKYAHDLELSKSVLHSLKLPSDAIEVLKSYAAGYRSRRTTLARLANTYGNALFMEPHSDGGFVLKCADLLEVSWRLDNKWSPVSPFHHRMKFDLEYMEESFIKTITQAHKQLLDPSIQTDERTLLLAKIISTCLEARGPVDQDSDLESKTTERDADIEKRDSETEKRDSEVMAPPKSLPKKSKQKNRDTVPNLPQKRSMDEDSGDGGPKRMKSSDSHSDVPKKSNADTVTNARKSKMSDVVNVGGKKSRTNEVGDRTKDKVANNVNEETGDTENKNINSKAKNKTVKPSGNTDNDNDGNTKIKNKAVKPSGNVENNKDGNTKTKNIKEPEIVDKGPNSKNKGKNVKEGQIEDKGSNTKAKPTNIKKSGNTVNNDDKDNKKPSKQNEEQNEKDANMKTKNKIANVKPKTKTPKETENTDHNEANTKPKNKNIVTNNKDGNPKKSITTKEAGNTEDNNSKPKNTEKKVKNVTSAKNSENTETTKITKPKVQTNKPTEKKSVANLKNAENNINKANIKQTAETAYTKENKEDETAKKVTNIKNKPEIPKIVSNDKTVKNVIKNKNKPEVTEKGAGKADKVKSVNLNSKSQNTVKKVIEKNATNMRNKDKISPITKDSDNKEKNTDIIKGNVSETVISGNTVTNMKSKESTNTIINNKKVPLTKTIKNVPLRLSTHRTALKVTNTQKTLKPGNTKMSSSGNTEKENSGSKFSKIPQKKLSSITESPLRSNPLRISPRKMPSKFKSSSQENTFKQKMIKTTNIPRLLKKPTPKTTVI